MRIEVLREPAQLSTLGRHCAAPCGLLNGSRTIRKLTNQNLDIDKIMFSNFICKSHFANLVNPNFSLGKSRAEVFSLLLFCMLCGHSTKINQALQVSTTMPSKLLFIGWERPTGLDMS